MYLGSMLSLRVELSFFFLRFRGEFFGFFFHRSSRERKGKNQKFKLFSHLAWNSTVSVNLADEVASTAATASPASSETSLVGT